MTENNGKTIDVLCCITPEGQLVYAWDRESAEQVTKDWRESLTDKERKAHDEARTTGGFVQIRMLRSDWDKLELTAWQSQGPLTVPVSDP